ncbi:hypothetical protein [Streptomyces decoyicus]|uniref:hypothetical protein n=1 Tax=Streptomyces decoyicus TaxID=249567 RepID=UPI0033B7DAC0
MYDPDPNASLAVPFGCVVGDYGPEEQETFSEGFHVLHNPWTRTPVAVGAHTLHLPQRVFVLLAGSVLGGVPRHTAHPAAQRGVRNKFAQFDPGIDLLVSGVGGQLRGGRQQSMAVGRNVEILEGFCHEVLDERAAFGCGHPGQFGHGGESLSRGVPAGDGAQDRLLRAQRADLYRSQGDGHELTDTP